MNTLDDFRFSSTPYTGSFVCPITRVSVVQPCPYYLRSLHKRTGIDFQHYSKVFDAIKAAYAIKSIEEDVQFYIKTTLKKYKGMSTRFYYDTLSIDVQSYALSDTHLNYPLSRFDYVAALEGDLLSIKARDLPEKSVLFGIEAHRKKGNSFKEVETFDLKEADMRFDVPQIF